jgi:hypothetical protein
VAWLQALEVIMCLGAFAERSIQPPGSFDALAHQRLAVQFCENRPYFRYGPSGRIAARRARA